MLGMTDILQGRSVTMTTGEISAYIFGVNLKKERTPPKESRVFAY